MFLNGVWGLFVVCLGGSVVREVATIATALYLE